VAGGERVPGRQGHHPGFADQWLAVQPSKLERGAEEADIRPAIAEHRRRLAPAADYHLDRGQVGSAGPVRRHHLTEQPTVTTGLECDYEPGLGVPGPLGTQGRGIHGLQGYPGLGEQDPARHGQRHSPGGPLQQPYPEGVLQLRDGLGQWRLGHAQPLGRPAEVELLGDRDEVAQLPDVEVTHTRSI
jgi:hypothetical protein